VVAGSFGRELAEESSQVAVAAAAGAAVAAAGRELAEESSQVRLLLAVCICKIRA